MIIGISGQDGAWLAKLLLEKGYRVYGTSRDAQTGTFGNLVKLGIRDQVKILSMVLNDFRSVIQILSSINADEIYNLAGQSSVGLSFELPMETYDSIAMGTLNLLESIRFLNARSRLYNASSSECFGNTLDEPATEQTPFRPRSPYAVAKATSYWTTANYREAYGLFACSGILFNHESPLRPERFVTRKIVRAACRISLGLQDRLELGNVDIQRDWGWAPDYVDAMWRMLQQESPDDFIIATGRTSSLLDFVKLVFACLDLDWTRYVHTRPELLRPSEIMVSRADTTKARRILGWQPSHDIEYVAKKMVAAEMAAFS
ncbi:GDP-mannose 4,6-dehydratase [Desulfobulbus propionicus]